MTEAEAKAQLEREGFADVYVWQDGPNAVYPDHTHPTLSAHIILEGDLTLTQGGATRRWTAGERVDVPAGAVHSARIGPRGCRYVIGE
ncbi:MAG: cupin domain-containing protein [Myxococcota bacterium]